MIVYAIIRRASGKAYVGSTTKSLKSRLRTHRHNASHPRLHKNNGHFARAVYTHGWDAFDVVELERCETVVALNEAERKWIDRFNATWPNGYNVREGGRDGALSATTKQRIAEKLIGRKQTESQRAAAVATFRKHRPLMNFKGERNGRSKMSPDDVRAIRAAWKAGGTTQQAIANQYGVTQMLIGKIVNRKLWNHLR